MAEISLLGQGIQMAPSADMMDDLEVVIHLRKIGLFSELKATELSAIASVAKKRIYPPQECIIREGEPGESLFLILKGRVSVVKGLGTQNEICLAELGPGECIGEMSLFDRKPRSASVVALEATEALELGRLEFGEVMAQFPNIPIQLCRVLSRRLRELQEKLTPSGIPLETSRTG